MALVHGHIHTSLPQFSSSPGSWFCRAPNPTYTEVSRSFPLILILTLHKAARCWATQAPPDFDQRQCQESHSKHLVQNSLNQTLWGSRSLQLNTQTETVLSSLLFRPGSQFYVSWESEPTKSPDFLVYPDNLRPRLTCINSKRRAYMRRKIAFTFNLQLRKV